MKHYKLICYILGGGLFLSLGTLIYRGYESGLEGHERCKQESIASLKSATELWANREFDKLGIPYSYEGGEPEVKSKKRRIVLSEGEFEVEVDSVKDTKQLLASCGGSWKIQTLFLLANPSIEVLNELWIKSLNDIQSHGPSALILQLELPGDRKGEKIIVGDSTLLTDEYKLGTYYLDDMYFLELTAYLSVPSPWLYVDWGDDGMVACLVVVAFCFCVLAFSFWYNRKKRDGGDINKSDDFVVRISENKYQIGGVLFDEEAGMLTFEDQNRVNCPMQAYKLLSAFIHAENHFLSNDKIVGICGWNLEDTGINEKRRVTISQFRKLLDSKKSHIKIESGKNEQKEQGFYLFVEKE